MNNWIVPIIVLFASIGFVRFVDIVFKFLKYNFFKTHKAKVHTIIPLVDKFLYLDNTYIGQEYEGIGYNVPRYLQMGDYAFQEEKPVYFNLQITCLPRKKIVFRYAPIGELPSNSHKYGMPNFKADSMEEGFKSLERWWKAQSQHQEEFHPLAEQGRKHLPVSRYSTPPVPKK